MGSNEASPHVTGVQSDVEHAPGARAEDRRLGSLRLHVASAASATTTGVLLYPTIFGLNQAMRGFARDLASAGMTAVVWDPYDGEDGTDVVPEMVARAKQREDETVIGDLRTVVDHMRDDLGLASIAGVGWCFGGRLAVLHAGVDDRIGPLSLYNPTFWSATPVDVNGRPMSRADWPGQTMDEFELAASVQGPVQVCRPEHDLTQPAEYERLMEVLRTRSAPTIYEYYPGSEHGFSYSPGDANERAHRCAWAITRALFTTELREPQPAA